MTIYFEGGGACWAGLLCDQGPYTTASNLTGFNAASIGAGGVNIARASFNRADLTNPFRNDTLIYVPYCTGDVHSGNNVATYDRADGGSFDIHHVGYANFGLEFADSQGDLPCAFAGGGHRLERRRVWRCVQLRPHSRGMAHRAGVPRR